MSGAGVLDSVPLSKHADYAPRYRTVCNAESSDGYCLEGRCLFLHRSQLQPYKDVIADVSIDRRHWRQNKKANGLLARQVESLGLVDERADGENASMLVD